MALEKLSLHQMAWWVRSSRGRFLRLSNGGVGRCCLVVGFRFCFLVPCGVVV